MHRLPETERAPGRRGRLEAVEVVTHERCKRALVGLLTRQTFGAEVVDAQEKEPITGVAQRSKPRRDLQRELSLRFRRSFEMGRELRPFAGFAERRDLLTRELDESEA